MSRVRVVCDLSGIAGIPLFDRGIPLHRGLDVADGAGDPVAKSYIKLDPFDDSPPAAERAWLDFVLQDAISVRRICFAHSVVLFG